MLGRLGGATGFVATMLAMVGCDNEATQLIVVVDTDIPIPAGLDAVTFEVTGTGDAASTTITLSSEAMLPLTLAVEPEGAAGPVEIRVTGALGGTDVVERVVDTMFLGGQRRVVNVFLSANCARVACGAEQTCINGTCASSFVDPETFPRFDGEPGRIDGGGPSDAIIDPRDADTLDGGPDGARPDAGDPDAGDPDAGPDADLDAGPDADLCGGTCAVGVACIDGVCENRLAVDVFMGQRFTCIRRADETISCLGDNRSGQLGDGTTSTDPVLAPVDVIGFGPGGDTATVLTLGFDTACAVTLGREVFCWGANEAGQIGDGTLMMRPVPQRVPGLTSIADVCSGSNHTCTVAVSGAVQCFGGNAGGQLGDGTTTPRNTPAPVSGPLDAAMIACGSGFTCAILSDDTIACWGDGERGENGSSTFMDTNVPGGLMVVGTPIALTVGSENGCAAFDDGTVRCWGAADFGRLGDGGASGGGDQFMPVPVPALADVSQIANGPTASHTCVLEDGNVLCWGGNRFGQIGDDNTGVSRPVPFMVDLPSPAIAVETGGVSTCAVLDTGRVWCWGENTRGQLGDGTTDDTGLPVEATAFFP